MSAPLPVYGFRDIAALIENDCNLERHLERTAVLLRVADELLALARQYANECGECGGTGQERANSYDLTMRQCSECADIRAVITRAAP